MATNAEFIQTLREAMAPEAVEFLEVLDNDKMVTTQDNYGRVMAFLGRMPEKDMQEAFLGALVDAGYPEVTGAAVARIMGLV